MFIEGELFTVREAIKHPRNLARQVAKQGLMLAERNLNVFPYVARVGIMGVGGVAPKAMIEHSTDRRRMLFLAGERKFTKRIVSVLKGLPQDSCFLDIGAAAGVYTLLSAAILKQGLSVAIEAEPEIFESLQGNVRLNGFEGRVKLLQVAATNQNGRARLYSNGPDGDAPSLRQDGRFGKFLDVEACRIDSLIAAGRIPYFHAVKIDVEGAEGLVLEGMEEILSDPVFRPWHVFLELHPPEMLGRFNSTQEQALEFLQKNGFRQVYRYERSSYPLIHFMAENLVG